MKKLIVIALLSVLSLSSHAADPSLESANKVKALFLYNFANFVEWPNESFNSPTEPIFACLYGEVPFAEYLAHFENTVIGQRPLKISRSMELEDFPGNCQILFVGNDRKAQLPTLFEQLKYTYVLSVGEQQDFTERGGVINILRTTDRVHFDVDISNAIENGLFISSDLLMLARQIRRQTANPASGQAPSQ